MDQKVKKLLNEAFAPRPAYNRQQQVTAPQRGPDSIACKRANVDNGPEHWAD
jgi:hypothetical protein